MGWVFVGLLGCVMVAGCAAAPTTAQPAAAPNHANEQPQPVAAPADRFSSELAGFEITKPSDWVFGTAEWESAARARVSVGTPELDAAIREQARLPLVIVLRYPEPSDVPNPTFKAGLRPLGALEGRSPSEIASIVIESMKPAMHAFELEGEIEQSTVGGLESANFRAKFQIKSDTATYDVRSKTWLVPRGLHLFIISGSDPSATPEVEAVFDSMVASIRIRPAN